MNEESTTEFHFSALNKFQRCILQHADKMWLKDVASAALDFFRIEMHHAQRMWQPQTLHRQMQNLVGAFALLPLYSDAKSGLRLTDNTEFRTTLAALKQMWRPIHSEQGELVEFSVVGGEKLLLFQLLLLLELVVLFVLLVLLVLGR